MDDDMPDGCWRDMGHGHPDDCNSPAHDPRGTKGFLADMAYAAGVAAERARCADRVRMALAGSWGDDAAATVFALRWTLDQIESPGGRADAED